MLAIIPARGGSKGLPGKNIKELCGKPLIAYTIEAAQQVKEIERVIVTTDSYEIAEVAKKYGAEVPFMRPKYLAEDTSLACDVYLHAVEFMQNQEQMEIENFIVLLPTTPLRNCENIKDALNLFAETKAETLISMVEADIPISWYYRVDENRKIKNAGFEEQNSLNNRQDNIKYYIPNGAIYILNYKLLKEKRTYYSENTVAYIMKRLNSIDIDTEDDMLYAEFMMKSQKKDKESGKLD